MFSKATMKERRQYYREEWSEKDLPGFIRDGIKKREFGFDHNGTGPNDTGSLPWPVPPSRP